MEKQKLSSEKLSLHIRTDFSFLPSVCRFFVLLFSVVLFANVCTTSSNRVTVMDGRDSGYSGKCSSFRNSEPFISHFLLLFPLSLCYRRAFLLFFFCSSVQNRNKVLVKKFFCIQLVIAAKVLSFFVLFASEVWNAYILVLTRIHQRIICFVVYIEIRQHGFSTFLLVSLAFSYYFGLRIAFESTLNCRAMFFVCLYALFIQAVRRWIFLSTPMFSPIYGAENRFFFAFICSKLSYTLCDKAIAIDKRFSNFKKMFLVKMKFLFGMLI